MSETELTLLAFIDRTLLAAVDITEHVRIAVAQGRADDDDWAAVRADVAAVAAALNEVIARGDSRVILDRLSSWASAALPLWVAPGERGHRRLLLGDAAHAAEMLVSSAAWARREPAAVGTRWLDMVSAGDVALLDAVWATAFLVSEAVSAEEAQRNDEESSLSVVLDKIRRGLAIAPDVMWDPQVVTPSVGRTPRYRLRTFIDPGSGVLIWSGNAQANARWDYPVNHYELPVPRDLADAIETLIKRYDDGSEDLNVDPPRPFVGGEWRAFVSSYFAIIDDLRRFLGPSCEISDESHYRRE